ncbi:PREDICTED: probable terpene synthase 9 isoform X2 [Populus euphratica]|uniref:Probable terpene synthase 9 isoform X2 n=1 Tax=Populus euphratica TaxID=75702 RepID=A0AAJ6X2Q7_POPEU|nr:PREDICTED: probable terpene synthase 9 isoform X2 [Populus euphratica]
MEFAVFALSPSSLVLPSHFPKTTILSRSHISARNKLFQSSRLPSLKNASIFKILSMNNEERRSANYHPSVWELQLIESLSTPYSYELHANRLEELKQEAKRALVSTNEPRAKLKLIDSIQRLGVAYHFEREIEEAMKLTELDVSGDLQTTSLHFRLLRQHAFSVSTDVFGKFRSNRDGKFKDSIRTDVAGLLSLYEASYLGVPGEDHVLEEAKNFSSKHLQSLLEKIKDEVLAKQVKQSLEVPLHWKMPRIEARDFIDVYSSDNTRNLDLLELAKLDYNLVQSQHQRELKELVRIGLTKFVCILTAIDDIYDVYGLPEELELFTKLVNRWDSMAIDDLPDYMKICYLALINFVNEMAYDVMRDHGLFVLPYLVEEWANLCGSYLVEARWFSNKYSPTLTEYLENARTSIGSPAALAHAYMLLGSPIAQSSLMDCFKHGSDQLIYWSSLITRLSDDLGTYTAESERGDVTKSIQCYMIEKGASEKESKVHIKALINQAWKELNKENSKCSLPKPLVNMSLNMARTAQCIFQFGDGIGTSTGVIRDRLTSLIVEPIPVKEP